MTRNSKLIQMKFSYKNVVMTGTILSMLTVLGLIIIPTQSAIFILVAVLPIITILVTFGVLRSEQEPSDHSEGDWYEN